MSVCQLENRKKGVYLGSTVIVAISMLLLIGFALEGFSRGAAANGSDVGLITDGPLNDAGYNWSAYQGLLRAQDQLGIVGTVYTSTTPADFGPNLTQCVNDGNALCLGVGFLIGEAISATAAANPATDFAVFDLAFESYPANLRGITFQVNEAAYLAGFLAGSMSESGIVGEIGGMSIPPVDDFIFPFRNGAQCASPGTTAFITYTNNFGDPALGAAVAQTLIGRGADVIFPPAGPTGNGAVLTATQSGVWGIGYDVDMYDSVFGSGSVDGADRLLTSVIKKLDSASFLTIQDVVSNTFTSGTLVYTLANEGVGLAPYHGADPAVPELVRARLAMVAQAIFDGKIDVNSEVCYYTGYLPLLRNGEPPVVGPTPTP